jgi:hypothetical protein
VTSVGGHGSESGPEVAAWDSDGDGMLASDDGLEVAEALAGAVG